jgi:hypothetical protein
MKSISQINSDYIRVCELASQNDLYFSSFKSNKSYNEILEHTSIELGKLYLKNIKENFPEYIDYIDQFKLNDTLGHSGISDTFLLTENISPSTLRYIKVASDIYNIFYKNKKIDLNNKTIIEIGCGYGGQCFILSQIFDFKDYFIVDIPEAQSLTQKYLNKLNTRCHIISIKDLPKISRQYDLVISNYAYSELDIEFQDFYYDNIITKSLHGYFTLNFISHLFQINSYSKKDLLIKLNNFKMITELQEDPKSFENNVIIHY